MNMQYEIAKMVTDNQIPDEEIDKELAFLRKNGTNSVSCLTK